MDNKEEREGFQVIAEITNRYWRQTDKHASTALPVGTGASLPAVTVPQAQLDLSHAIREAFHAGAALQASLQPMRWSIAMDPDNFGDDMRSATMVGRPAPLCQLSAADLREMGVAVMPDTRIDLAAVAEQLPRREPNPHVKLFADEALQLFCPTCHQATPLPHTPTHAGPCGAGCDVPAAVAT